MRRALERADLFVAETALYKLLARASGSGTRTSKLAGELSRKARGRGSETVRVREAVGGAERDELAAVRPLARSTRLQLYRVPPLQPRDPTQPRPPARQPRRRRVPPARQRDSASPSRAHGQGGAARPQGQGQGPRAHLRQGARPHEGGQAPGASLSSSSAPRSHLAGADTSHTDSAQLIEDPELEERVLSSQLKEAGLYAANILGGASLPLALSTRRARARELTPRSLARADGNCLFRALSDQLYGSPSMHQAIRQEVRSLPLSLGSLSRSPSSSS